MAEIKIKFYPPSGGPPVEAYPEYKKYYLDNGFTFEPQEGKTKKPKQDGKSTKKVE